MDLEVEEKEAEVSLDKVYKLPKYCTINFDEKTIVLFYEKATWLICENESQLKIFSLLYKKKSLGSVIELFGIDNTDLINVITQLEAKKLKKKM